MKTRYPVNECVSVWVGTYPSEDDLDLDIDSLLEPQLSLPTHLSSICEYSFEEESDIAELLNGFSGASSFLEQAVSAASNRKIFRANSALVCYYLRVDECPPSLGRLQFLGSFKGSDVS